MELIKNLFRIQRNNIFFLNHGIHYITAVQNVRGDHAVSSSVAANKFLSEQLLGNAGEKEIMYIIMPW